MLKNERGCYVAESGQTGLKAAAVAGLALLITVIVAWLAETAPGHRGYPYDWLAALGGIAYVFAAAFFCWCS